MSMKNFPKLSYWLLMRLLLFHFQWWSLCLALIWSSFHLLSMGKSCPLYSYVLEKELSHSISCSQYSTIQAVMRDFVLQYMRSSWMQSTTKAHFFNLQGMKVLVGLCLWSFYSNWKSKARCLLMALYLVCLSYPSLSMQLLFLIGVFLNWDWTKIPDCIPHRQSQNPLGKLMCGFIWCISPILLFFLEYWHHTCTLAFSSLVMLRCPLI